MFSLFSLLCSCVGGAQYVFIRAWWRIWQRKHAFFDLLQYKPSNGNFSLVAVAPHVYCSPAAKDCLGGKQRVGSYLPRYVTSWSAMEWKQTFRVSRATCLRSSSAIARWGTTLRAARSNCAWIVSSANFAIKFAISWSLQVRPRSPIFNSLLHFVTGFDPTPEQGRTRVVYPGRTRVRLAHVIATTGSNPSRTRVRSGLTGSCEMGISCHTVQQTLVVSLSSSLLLSSSQLLCATVCC